MIHKIIYAHYLPQRVFAHNLISNESKENLSYKINWHLHPNDGNTLSSRVINDELIVKTKQIKRKKYIIPVRVVNKTIKLKPGQQWNETDQKTQDNYEVSKPKIIKKPEAEDSTTNNISDLIINP